MKSKARVEVGRTNRELVQSLIFGACYTFKVTTGHFLSGKCQYRLVHFENGALPLLYSLDKGEKISSLHEAEEDQIMDSRRLLLSMTKLIKDQG